MTASDPSATTAATAVATATPAAAPETFWSWLTGEADEAWAFLKNLWKSLVSSEVAALAPIAESALETLGVDFTGVTTLSGVATVAGQVLTATASQAEAAGLQAAGSSLIAAVGGAIANAQAAAAGQATS